MKKVFISLPMHGISHEEIERKLEKIRTDYRERLEKGLGDEIEFVDNLDFVPAVENPSRLNYLAGAVVVDVPDIYRGVVKTYRCGEEVEFQWKEDHLRKLIRLGNEDDIVNYVKGRLV